MNFQNMGITNLLQALLIEKALINASSTVSYP